MSVILTSNNIREATRTASSATQERAEPYKAEVHPTAEVRVDDMIDRILKLIPGEAAAAYTVACSLVKGDAYLPIVAFVLSAIVLILTIRRSAASLIPPVKPEPLQYVLRLAAFFSWAFAIENPIKHWVTIPSWIPMLGILFIPIFGTFLFENYLTLDVHDP